MTKQIIAFLDFLNTNIAYFILLGFFLALLGPQIPTWIGFVYITILLVVSIRLAGSSLIGIIRNSNSRNRDSDAYARRMQRIRDDEDRVKKLNIKTNQTEDVQ